jgi:hypothetical protein
MSTREAAVARVLVRAYGRDFDTDDIAKRAVRAADRAGSGRKPRTITTTEGLIGLPNNSLILSTGRHQQFAGRVYRVKSAGMVERVGKEIEGVTPFRYFVDPLPVIVIHEPEDTA